MKRIADFYVLLEPRGSFNKAVVVKAVNSRPATSPRQIAVRVRLTLPENAFTTWTPLVEAEVDQALLVPPTVEIIDPAPEQDTGEAAA